MQHKQLNKNGLRLLVAALFVFIPLFSASPAFAFDGWQINNGNRVATSVQFSYMWGSAQTTINAAPGDVLRFTVVNNITNKIGGNGEVIDTYRITVGDSFTQVTEKHDDRTYEYVLNGNTFVKFEGIDNGFWGGWYGPIFKDVQVIHPVVVVPEPTPTPTVEPTPEPEPVPVIVTPTVPAIPTGQYSIMEGGSVHLTAPAGMVIGSVTAWYGDPNDGSRGADWSLQYTEQLRGLSEAELSSGNYFGDPVPGVWKVLIATVNYISEVPVVIPAPEPTPAPQPEPTPIPEPTPTPTEDVRQPDPVVVPQPTPTEDARQPEPTPTPTPTEDVRLVEPTPPAPAPEPTPSPAPAPVPIVAPEPVVIPDPEPIPVEQPAPVEEPTPTPTPVEEKVVTPTPEEEVVVPVEEEPATVKPEATKTVAEKPEEVKQPEVPVAKPSSVATLLETPPEQLTKAEVAELKSAAIEVFATAEQGSPAYEKALEMLAVVAEADDKELPAELAAIPLLGDVAGAVLDVFNNIGNIGADMSPEQRAKAEKTVVGAVVVGQVAQLAAAGMSAASIRKVK